MIMEIIIKESVVLFYFLNDAVKWDRFQKVYGSGSETGNLLVVIVVPCSFDHIFIGILDLSISMELRSFKVSLINLSVLP
jgi:hypothetical protein